MNIKGDETMTTQEIAIPEDAAHKAAWGERPANAVTPMQMLQLAVEKGADIDQLTKLMDLHERWEASEARKAYVEAMTAFKANPPTVIRNKHVSFGARGGGTEFDHATLDQVVNVIGPALAEHGLSHSWQTEQDDPGSVSVTCILTHRMGHSERVTLSGAADNSGSKNTIQAIGSTVTYLQRYTLLAATGLAAKDQDDDATLAGAPGLITGDQAEELMKLATEVKADPEKFLAYLNVDAFTNIPAKAFKDAKAALERKREK